MSLGSMHCIGVSNLGAADIILYKLGNEINVGSPPLEIIDGLLQAVACSLDDENSVTTENMVKLSEKKG